MKRIHEKRDVLKQSISFRWLNYLLIFSLVLSAAGSGYRENEDENVFVRYYNYKKETDSAHDYTNMCVEMINKMACNTESAIVDTEELLIEVSGAIVSGNTAEIFLRVTAKQLDSVLKDNGNQHLCNYRFGDETAMLSMFTLANNFEVLSHAYYYSDVVNELRDNQFYLYYKIVAPNLSKMETLTIPLQDFGSYSSGTLTFEPLYSGCWQIEVPFSPAQKTNIILQPNKQISIGGLDFFVDELQFTPLACTIHLTYSGDSSVDDENNIDIGCATDDIRDTCSIVLADGVHLDSAKLDFFSGNIENQYFLVLSFWGPIAVDKIESLQMLGVGYSLK